MTTENGQKQNEPYSFMKETRKKRPADRKIWIRRVLLTGLFAIFAGLLAALCFVLSVPVFQGLLKDGKAEPEKIEIAAESVALEEEEAAEQEKREEAEPEVPEERLTAEEEQELALVQYKKMRQAMMNQARDAEHAMVDVISISSQLDYFNHNYENQQQLSGLLIAQDSGAVYCLTENRGLKKAEKIQIGFSDGSKASAEYKCSDVETNLAILKIARSEIPDITWNELQLARIGNSNMIRQGDPVIALGSILGIGGTIEYGNITSIQNTVSLWDADYNIYTTDMIGSSNGNGILLNLAGEVVGVIAQKFSPENQNLITVIPVSQLKPVMETLVNGEPQIRIGIKGQTVTTDISETTGIPKGILISAIEPESPAMFAGIKEYDVITAVAGQETVNFTQYENVIANLDPDVEIVVNALRMGKENYEEISFRLNPETK